MMPEVATQSEPPKTLTKEERKALKEQEKNRPKRKYVKKSEQLKGIKISTVPIVISFA
jgi:hypothetical protein